MLRPRPAERANVNSSDMRLPDSWTERLPGSRNSRRRLVARPALRPNRLADFLPALPLSSGEGQRPSAHDRCRLRPHPRRRPLVIPFLRPIPIRSRRHIPATLRPIHPGHLFRIPTPTARHRLLHFLLLRAATANLALHGRRARPRIAATHRRRSRIRDPRLELSIHRVRRRSITTRKSPHASAQSAG